MTVVQFCATIKLCCGFEKEREMDYQKLLIEKIIPSGISITRKEYLQLSQQVVVINILRFVIACFFTTPLGAVLFYVASGYLVRAIYQDRENYLIGLAYVIGLSNDILEGLKKVKKEEK